MKSWRDFYANCIAGRAKVSGLSDDELINFSHWYNQLGAREKCARIYEDIVGRLLIRFAECREELNKRLTNELQKPLDSSILASETFRNSWNIQSAIYNGDKTTQSLTDDEISAIAYNPLPLSTFSYKPVEIIEKLFQPVLFEMACRLDKQKRDIQKYESVLTKDQSQSIPSTAMKIYIASSWKNQHAVELITKELRSMGHTVLSFVENNHGEQDNSIPFDEWVMSPNGIQSFNYDTRGATKSDLVIYVGPSGSDAWAEVGAAWASGVKVIALLSKGEQVGLMRRMATWVKNVDELFKEVAKGNVVS